MENRLAGLTGVVLIAFTLLIYYLYPNDRVEFSKFNSNDGTEYLALAKSLVQNGLYTRNVDGDYIPHKTWPPGMPILLSPSINQDGSVNLLLAKLIIITLSLISLFLIWLITFVLTKSCWLGLLITSIVGLNPIFWELSRVLLPSIPVTFWCLLSFYAIYKAFNSNYTFKYYFLIGFICGIGMLLKGTVIALASLPVAYFLYSKCSPHEKFLSDYKKRVV